MSLQEGMLMIAESMETESEGYDGITRVLLRNYALQIRVAVKVAGVKASSSVKPDVNELWGVNVPGVSQETMDLCRRAALRKKLRDEGVSDPVADDAEAPSFVTLVGGKSDGDMVPSSGAFRDGVLWMASGEVYVFRGGKFVFDADETEAYHNLNA